MEGRRIGSFRIVRQIGAGGMATVFEGVRVDGASGPLPAYQSAAPDAATKEATLSRVAIKVLHPVFAQNPDAAQRFINEARASSMLGHPAFVRIHDSGISDDGLFFLTMEYLEGHSLHERLNRSGGKLPEAEAVRLCREIAQGLAVAHERGIAHRDLKPENIMLVPITTPSGETTEQVKILDFGIAKLHLGGNAPSMTRADSVMGTPTYMAPEQCKSARGVEKPADSYALGVILYQMLAGRPPFVGTLPAEVMAMHLFEKPKPIVELVPSVSPVVAALIDLLLKKLPGERPTMPQIVERLEKYERKLAGVEDPTVVTREDAPRQRKISLTKFLAPTMFMNRSEDPTRALTASSKSELWLSRMRGMYLNFKGAVKQLLLRLRHKRTQTSMMPSERRSRDASDPRDSR